MTEIVTLTEAKDHLRVAQDENYDDAMIALYIAAATEAVLTVTDDWAAVEGEPVPARLKVAVLMRIAVMFDTRDSIKPGDGEPALLMPLRQVRV